MLDYASIPLEHEYAKENQSSSVDSGCIELFKAILESALVDLRNNQYRDRALNWIFAGRDDCLSFIGICDLLSLDSSVIRRKVLHYMSMAPKDRRKLVKSRLLP